MTKLYMCFLTGSCVATDENPDSAMKLLFSFASKADKIWVPSPTVDKPLNGDHRIAGLGFKSLSSPHLSSLTSFRDFGSSKEETFFDSQSRLESDCEDDFFSSNGDFFTPSRGNTPNHQSGFIVTPRLNKSLSKGGANKSLSKGGAAGTRAETSPPYKKKKLAELFFLESFWGDQDADYQPFAANQSISNGKLELKPINLDIPPRSTNGTPYVSGLNFLRRSYRAANKNLNPNKKKSARSIQCCLPIFVWS